MGFRRLSCSDYLAMCISFVALIVVVGCGGGLDTAAVSGTVNVDGKPLARGVIRFVPTDGTSGPRRTIAVKNGRFSATVDQGPVIGANLIQIESTIDVGVAPDDPQAAEAFVKSRKHVRVVVIPEKFNKRTRIKEEISGDGPNELTFDLKTK